MKNLLFPILLLFVELTYSQTDYYRFDASDSLYSQESIKSVFNSILTTSPNNYLIVPTIYNRIIQNDSIINFLEFKGQENTKGIDRRIFKFVFSQDSLFLLLNKKLPDFKLEDIEGNEFSSFQLIGKPTLINFWAISCSPCVAEIPDLNKLEEKYGTLMNFVAITDMSCDKDRMNLFLEKKPFNFKLLYDNLTEYKKNLGVKSIPRNIFIDKEGYIRYIKSGYNPINYLKEKDQFLNIIEELIKKQ